MNLISIVGLILGAVYVGSRIIDIYGAYKSGSRGKDLYLGRRKDEYYL